MADGRIVEVGSTAALLPLRTATTRVVACGGGRIERSFVDAHVHLLGMASRLLSVDCADARSISEIVQRLRAKAASLPSDAWVRGSGYDDATLAEGRHPTRLELDDAVPGHPVRLRHRSRHASVLNSLGLARAGIDVAGAGPSAGPVCRGEDGLASGLVIDMDRQLKRCLPPYAADEMERALAQSSSALARVGVTAIHEATADNGPATWSLFRRMAAAGSIRQDVTMLHAPEATSDLPRGSHSELDGRLRLGPLKVLMSTAGGDVTPDTAELNRLLTLGEDSGRGAAVHVADLECLAVALCAVEEHRGANGRCSVRFEHVPVCPPALADCIAALDVAVVVQPGFLFASGERYLRDVEPELQADLYPLRSLLHAGVRVLGSSDAPVGPLAPLLGMRAARERLSSGGQLVAPGQALSASAAARLYRPHGVAPQRGMPADLVVLDPADVAGDTLLTVHRGEPIWERDDA